MLQVLAKFLLSKEKNIKDENLILIRRDKLTQLYISTSGCKWIDLAR